MALVTAPAALPLQVRNANSERHLQVVRSVPQLQPAQKQPIKLTRRGRRFVALLALIPIVISFFFMGTRGAQADSTSPTTASVVVKPGQSLWDIASTVAPTKDPRETIWVIEQLNGMKTADVLAGQELLVPINK